MGVSCDCRDLELLTNELNVDKEKKVNQDFFIDYSPYSVEICKNKTINAPFDKNISKNSLNNFDLKNKQKMSNYNLTNNSKSKTIKLDDILINFNYKIKKREIILRSSTQNFPKKIKGKIIKNINYIKIVDKPKDEYSRFIFEYMNKLRTEPKNIAEDIENIKKYIYIEENNSIVFKKNKIKVNLYKGIQVFNEVIKILNNLQPMKQLIYDNNITIEIPEDEKMINNIGYLKDKVKELNTKGIYINSFWKEIIKDPEVAFLMMVIDDNYIKTGQKREDLINPDISYIGINSGEIKDNFVCYITLRSRL